jgi:Cyclic nucleotide-binding domain./Bacterial regulatory proteins, crp family.
MFSLSNILPLVADKDKDMLVNLFKNAPSYITERSVIKNLLPGQTLLYADHKADAVFFHITGRLAGADTFNTGVIYNFIELHPVNIIGEFEAFSSTSNYLINIRAITRATLIDINLNDFLMWMQTDIGALNIICRLLALKLSKELKTNREYLFLNSYERLMLYIYEYVKESNQNSTVTTIHKKHSEIADEIGFCVKTINRTITKLEDDGLISFGRNNIKVTSEQFLILKSNIKERGLA